MGASSRRGPSLTGSWRSSGARESPSKSPTRGSPTTPRSPTPWRTSPSTRGCRSSRPRTPTMRRLETPTSRRRSPRCARARHWTTWMVGCREVRERICAARGRCCGGIGVIRKRSRRRRGSAQRARSTSTSWRRTCRRTQFPRAIRRRRGYASSPTGARASGTARPIGNEFPAPGGRSSTSSP